jgi:cytoskeletal protein CcmA (bactofilin family)
MWNREAMPKTDEPRQPQTAESAAADRALEERRIVAWVGKSVAFKGDLTSFEDMMIDGRVEGTIELPDHTLTIGPDADIRADIVARSVVVRGALKGTITAKDKVELRETASVDGDILSPRMVMADGAVFRGRVDTLALRAEAITPPLRRVALA